MAGLEARSLALLALFIVIIHITSWGVLLSHINELSLFGKRLFQFNRYYSAKSVHVHKANGVSATQNPSHWESLGLIIPAADENYNVQKYAIDKNSLKKIEYPCAHNNTAACWLENNHGDYVFLNGESMSALSEISPSIYFGTLLTIYLLSSIVIVSNTLTYYLKDCIAGSDSESIEKNIRYILIFINLLVYVSSILFAYGTSPFINETKILGVKVEYSISSHLASILPCSVTLILYLLHLRGRKINWFEDEPAEGEEASSSSEFVADGQDNQGLEMAPLAFSGLRSSQLYEKMPLSTGSGVYFVQTNTNAPTANFVGLDKIFKYDENAEFLKLKNNSLDTLIYGPNSSESSVIGALTVFLGGIGSLGLARGTLQEVEVQLVLGCTLGFAFVEICSYRMYAYWQYMFSVLRCVTPEKSDYETVFWRGIKFIRFVCLWIQLWFLVLYYNTIMHLKLLDSMPQYIVYALMFLYWSLSFLVFFGMFTFPMPTTKLKTEIAYCVIAFIVFSISLLVYNGNTGNLQIDDSLVLYENTQYDLKTVNENVKCQKPGNLKYSSLVHDDIKKYSVDSSTNDNWVGRSEVDVVELKVYYWTKGWNVQLIQKPNFVVWFCKNGLEHHWGQCIFNKDFFCGPSSTPIPKTQCEDAIVQKIASDSVIKYY